MSCRVRSSQKRRDEAGHPNTTHAGRFGKNLHDRPHLGYHVDPSEPECRRLPRPAFAQSSSENRFNASQRFSEARHRRARRRQRELSRSELEPHVTEWNAGVVRPESGRRRRIHLEGVRTNADRSTERRDPRHGHADACRRQLGCEPFCGSIDGIRISISSLHGPHVCHGEHWRCRQPRQRRHDVVCGDVSPERRHDLQLAQPATHPVRRPARRRRIEAARLTLSTRHDRPPADTLKIGPSDESLGTVAMDVGGRCRAIEADPALAKRLRARQLGVIQLLRINTNLLETLSFVTRKPQP